MDLERRMERFAETDLYVVITEAFCAGRPAVDVLDSISRVMIDIVDQEHKFNANNLLNVVATYKRAEDLINIGAYVKGSNPEIDFAIKMNEKVNAYLKQGIDEKVDFESSRKQLLALFN